MKFEICGDCMFRDGQLGLCDSCEEGDQFEQDFDAGDEPDEFTDNRMTIRLALAA